MTQYNTNQLILINDKFKITENNFSFNFMLKQSLRNQLIKNYSHQNFTKRPYLQKQKQIKISNAYIKHQLDKIGNNDLIFNNDKLITNIKLDRLDYLPSIDDDKIFNIKNPNQKSFLSSTKGRNRNHSNYTKINKTTLNSTGKDNSHISSNKVRYQIKNLKESDSKNKIHTKTGIRRYYFKKIDKFLNKPTTRNISQKSLLMTPLYKKSPNRMLFNNTISKIGKSKYSFRDNKSENSSIFSYPKYRLHNIIRGKSMPNYKNNKTHIRFPGKSVIKNKEKLMIEMKKIFGDKLHIYENFYHSMTEDDKKNCMVFLLDTIKELYNTNRLIQGKIEGYKEINDNKEKMIKEDKKQIKELKKEIYKLNKAIQSNNKMNKKLTDNINLLKSQLEKQKEKNKILETESKSRDNSAKKNIFNNRIRYKKNMNEINLTNSKRNIYNRSQDKSGGENDFCNKKIDFEQNLKNYINKERKMLDNINLDENIEFLENDTTKK